MESLDITRPFTARTAAETIGRHRLRGMIDNHEVRTLARGLYVGSSVPDTIELRAAALGLILPDHLVIADRSAAWLHGVDVFDLAAHQTVPDIDVMSVDGHDATELTGCFAGKRDLVSDEIWKIGGVRVTSPVRTACDVACLRGRYQAMAALDGFRRTCRVSVADLERQTTRFRGRRGVKQLRELIPLSTDEADSAPESWSRLMIHDAGLPMPAAQVWALLSDGRSFRLENAYEQYRIAVEYDGLEHHSSSADRARDEERRAALAREGWIIIVIRKGDLGAKARERWLCELREAIRVRTEHPQKRIYSRGPDAPPYPRRPRR